MKRRTSQNVLALSERFLLAAFLTVAAVIFTYNNWLWRWDYLLYDSQLSLWQRQPSEQLVIINIDDYSLSKLGHWPWPRSIHAELLNRLMKEKPKAIGLDIIFSEADRNNPQNDQALAQAIQKAGNVVLPIYMSQQRENAYPFEALPMPILSQHAAALGHVHIDLSDDGIARQVFLFEGIGTSQWPHFSLALLHTAGYSTSYRPVSSAGKNLKQPALAERSNKTQNSALPLWSRKSPVLIPFAGPPGYFPRISYAQVLDGEYPKAYFKNKIILIGATAEGMGDILPTPFSGHSRAMSGVEINANIIDAILNGIELKSIDNRMRLLLTVFLVIAPLFAFQYLKPRTALLTLVLIIFSTLGLSAILLWLQHIWFSPAVAVLFQVISYPLWSWRKLELAVRHLNHELDGLHNQRKKLGIHHHSSLHRSVQFMCSLLPIDGWVLINDEGKTIMSSGKAPAKDKNLQSRSGWNISQYCAWATVTYHHRRCRLGLSFELDSIISEQEIQLLNQLLYNLQENEQQENMPGDFLDAKIRQIQLAEEDLLRLRRFIDDGLSNMSDGVIVCDACGEILMSNARASWYLMGDDDIKLDNLSLYNILADIQLSGNASWKPLLHKVLIMHQRIITQAQHKSGRDLMVQISPLNSDKRLTDGLVINLSDIQLLKASEKKRDELLNFLSHDLRSPLSSTLALLELAKTKENADELHETLSQVSLFTHKTLHLAEQFLHLSRAKSSEDLPLYDIDFNTVALNAIEQVWTLAKAKNIQISQSFKHDELWILGEPDLLERAVVNLLSNAIKYSESNTSIKVEISLHNNNIRCCVIDEGFGISEEDLPDLFELFKRVHREGEKRKLGIGLGLAFVDAVAKRHQGHVDVESTAGSGSSFCLVIPYIAQTQSHNH